MKSVLYVDDEEVNLLLFKLNFKDNYQIYTAASAKEGYDIVKNNVIDVIITDYKMPDLTGIDFITLLNADNMHKPSIILSAYIESAIMQNNKKLVYKYVSKPWMKEDLQEIIEDAIGYNQENNS